MPHLTKLAFIASLYSAQNKDHADPTNLVIKMRRSLAVILLIPMHLSFPQIVYYIAYPLSPWMVYSKQHLIAEQDLYIQVEQMPGLYIEEPAHVKKQGFFELYERQELAI